MLKIDDLDTNILDMGQGECVVLLHGWGGSSLSMLGLANELSSKYRVIVPDLWGFGKSQKPPKSFTIFDYADLIEKLLAQLKLSEVTLVGHSFGGRIALILASRHKEFVQSLVLIDSAGLKPKFSLIRYFRIKRYKHLKKLVQAGQKPEYVLDRFGSQDYKTLDEDLKQVFVNVVNEDLSCLLNQIEQKTLILWGRHDKDTPRYMAKTFNKNIKNSKLFWLDGGHFAYLTQQKKALKYIFEFLEG